MKTIVSVLDLIEDTARDISHGRLRLGPIRLITSSRLASLTIDAFQLGQDAGARGYLGTPSIPRLVRRHLEPVR